MVRARQGAGPHLSDTGSILDSVARPGHIRPIRSQSPRSDAIFINKKICHETSSTQKSPWMMHRTGITITKARGGIGLGWLAEPWCLSTFPPFAKFWTMRSNLKTDKHSHNKLQTLDLQKQTEIIGNAYFPCEVLESVYTSA